MPRYYRAVALDLDGTISAGGPPDSRVVDAIRAARQAGIHVVLVTGRVRADLDADMPGLAAEFDAVVTENGAVLAVAGKPSVTLAEPVPLALAERLRGQGVAVHRGEVLLACDASGAHLAFDATHALHLDAQLVWNRAALMLLPAGVTKGTGVRAALSALGISAHSTIGVGDAENDHALLQACEVGVAVSNAIPSLADRADVVLSQPDGTGVATLLDDVAAGRWAPRSRNQLVLGTTLHGGQRVTISAAPSTILITGDSGSGKSYLTGLLSEQMIGLGYSVLVLDPEGDHTELGSMPNTLLVGATGRLPSPEELMQIIEHGNSVVVDLSLKRARHQLAAYLRDVHRQLREHRDRYGLPHWFVMDEAHLPIGLAETVEYWGYCLSTYRPETLPAGLTAAARWSVRLRSEVPGELVLSPSGTTDDAGVRVRTAARTAPHVRHHHKYVDSDVRPDRGFHFRDDTSRTGAIATNLRQFLTEVATCDRAVIDHHLRGHDFSRWTHDVLGDPDLADRITRIEQQHRSSGGSGTARAALVAAVAARYGIGDPW